MIDTLSFNALGAAPSFKFDKMASATRVLGAPFLVVRFWDMLCALKLGLPEECFAFGHQLDRFEQHGGEEGGVTLHFAEGKPPCRVRYLIDAGGLRSTTRKQLTGDSPIPWLRATFSLLPADRVDCTRDSAGGGVPGELGFVAGDSLSVTTMGLSDGGVMWAQANLRGEPTAWIDTSETALRTCLDARYNGDESWPRDSAGFTICALSRSLPLQRGCSTRSRAARRRARSYWLPRSLTWPRCLVTRHHQTSKYRKVLTEME